MNLVELSLAQYSLVSNVLSLAVAAMMASFVFFVLSRQELTAPYRPAMVMSALVVFIAGYHYLRIFSSWHDAYGLVDGVYRATGVPFNDAYRYVDWILTVPLLCAELVAVMNFKPAQRGSLMARLVVAAALMIGLGYPGEIATGTSTRVIWGLLSTLPFLYILYVLWSELSKAAKTESPEVQVLLRNTRLLLLGTWGFYPIAYLMPLIGVSGATATVALQTGYSIADIAAKCGYGVMIYAIARAKMGVAREASPDASLRAA